MVLGPQFYYQKVEGIEGVPAMDGGEYHLVVAKHPETGEKMGHLSWDYDFVDSLSTLEPYRRQGVATGMWNYAKQMADEGKAPTPRHSPIRTEAGRAWAEKVGGDFPYD